MAKRVVLAMSGGVDSSAAAVLLHRQGYEIIGLFMRSGESEKAACEVTDGGLLPVLDTPTHKQGCCSAEDAADARRVADQLGIPFHSLNFQDSFQRIKDYFVDEYLSGRTPNPCVQYDLALDKDEIERLRRFMVEGRKRFSIVIVDSYWDGSGEPFCPAAEGLSHHINPYGDIEPCPVVQFATDNINNGKLTNIYEDSKFLREFRLAINEKTKGCILMEDPEWLIEFAEKQNAKNTSKPRGSDITIETAAHCMQPWKL